MDKHEEVEKLVRLKRSGVFSEEGFEREKQRLYEQYGSTALEILEKLENPIPKDKSNLPSTPNNDDWLVLFFSYEGRINRTQYLTVHIFRFLGFISLDIIAGVSNFLATLSLVILLYSGIAIGIKRFHDINRSGWFLLVPFYNLIAPWFFPGTKGDNRYGPQPK